MGSTLLRSRGERRLTKLLTPQTTRPFRQISTTGISPSKTRTSFSRSSRHILPRTSNESLKTLSKYPTCFGGTTVGLGTITERLKSNSVLPEVISYSVWIDVSSISVWPRQIRRCRRPMCNVKPDINCCEKCRTSWTSPTSRVISFSVCLTTTAFRPSDGLRLRKSSMALLCRSTG